jgi:hypothetical protein
MRVGGALLSVLVVLAYLIVFPRELDEELLLRRSWSQSVRTEYEVHRQGNGAAAQPSVPEEPPVPRSPFRLGEYFGFVTSAGEFSYVGRALFDVSMDTDRFANFSRVSESTVIQGSDGSFLQNIPERGYPILGAGRILMFDSDGRTVSEWHGDGRELWRRSFGSLISDIDLSESAVALGYLDGSVALVIEGGSRTLRFEPRGSRVEITYGVAVNDDGSILAAVSGLDPQRLSILATSSDGLTPIRQRELDTAFRRPIFMEFVARDLAIVEQVNEVVLTDIAEGREIVLPVAGSVFRAGYFPETELVALLMRRDGAARGNVVLYIFRSSGQLVLTRGVGPGDAEIRMLDGTMLLGAGDTLLGVEVLQG